MSYEERLIESFAWIEREDGAVLPVGTVHTPSLLIPILPGFFVEAIDASGLAQELDLEEGDVLRGVINE